MRRNGVRRAGRAQRAGKGRDRRSSVSVRTARYKLRRWRGGGSTAGNGAREKERERLGRARSVRERGELG
jgi:hypothetical protein